MEAIKISSENDLSEHLQCLQCGHQTIIDYRCAECGTTYSQLGEVLDCLHDPVEATVSELKGMAIENDIAEDHYEDFKVRTLDNPQGISDKLKLTANDHSHYYRQTMDHYEQAVEAISNHKVERVLEIGSCFDYYFLKPFQEKGAECFGVNIHFDLKANDRDHDWVFKVLADMNRLPFKEGLFDLVIISATSHHSVTPEVLVKEIYRVLKPGGKCLMINDPTWGVIKNLGGPDNTQAFRESHINENEYSIWRYNKMFRRAGFHYDHLFSRFYDQKLLNVEIHPDTRFAFVAKIVKKAWQINLIRSFLKKYFLWPAQAIFGFPMNVVLTK